MKRAEEINCQPKGTELPPIQEMPGFTEWSESPIALEILARLEAKVVFLRREAEGNEAECVFESGICQGMEAAFGAISGGRRAIAPAIFTRA